MPKIDEHGRTWPPSAGDEVETVLGFLDYQRATFAWKTRGLDAAGLAATVGVSTMTLGGMLKHLAFVEEWWCSQWLHGRAPEPPFDTAEFETDPDWEWHSAADDTPEELVALWESSVARSRELVDESLREGGLGILAARSGYEGERPSLRWILLHLIEEYARHVGHADLIREAVDGQTGE